MANKRTHRDITVADWEANVPVFHGVDRWLLESMVNQGKTYHHPAEQLLLQAGQSADTFFFLQRGSVRVFCHLPQDGREVAIKLFRAPAVFGEMECLVGIPYLESVSTLEPSSILALPRQVLLDSLAASALFANNLLRDLAARLCIASQYERALAFDDVTSRLAALFLNYIDFYGLPVEGGTLIRISLSQEQLANSLGVGRRSITRALKQWTDAGTISKRGRQFVVADKEALTKLIDPKMLRITYDANWSSKLSNKM